MRCKRYLGWASAAAIVVASQTAQAATIPVTGWAIHNGSGSVSDAGTNSPSVTPADNSLVLMAPFDAVTLLNDGDFVQVSGSLSLDTRVGDSVGETGLNTQLRFGLFDGPAGVIIADDMSNTGFIIEYSDVPAGGLIREQMSLTQPNPFVGPSNIGNGVQDSGDDHIQGADIGLVHFVLRLTRNAGLIDLSGEISGTDSVTGNPYSSSYSVAGYSPVGFTYDRVGVFFGPRVDGNLGTTNPDFTGTLHNVFVSTPEPSSCLLALAVAWPAVLLRRRASSL